MFLRISPLVLAFLSACVPPQTRKPAPIPRVQGKPLTVNVLGHTYTIPAQMKVKDHLDQPGVFVLSMVDTINRCQTEIAFISTTQDSKLKRSFNDESAKAKWGYQQAHIAVIEKNATRKLWGSDALLRTLLLSHTKEKAAMTFFMVFAPKQSLGVRGKVFCDDPGFVGKARNLLFSLLASQEGGEAK